LELNEARPAGDLRDYGRALTEAQMKVVIEHLRLVFRHDIAPPKPDMSGGGGGGSGSALTGTGVLGGIAVC
jgi:hypothetical protein